MYRRLMTLICLSALCSCTASSTRRDEPTSAPGAAPVELRLAPARGESCAPLFDPPSAAADSYVALDLWTEHGPSPLGETPGAVELMKDDEGHGVLVFEIGELEGGSYRCYQVQFENRLIDGDELSTIHGMPYLIELGSRMGPVHDVLDVPVDDLVGQRVQVTVSVMDVGGAEIRDTYTLDIQGPSSSEADVMLDAGLR